jgi:AbrB family looped-hinge helix DNA binding protein
MHTATITSKGQITIPLAVRQALGLHAGTQLDFAVEGDGLKLVPLRHLMPSLKGRFAGRASAPVSLAMMDEAIAAEVLARHGKHSNKQS